MVTRVAMLAAVCALEFSASAQGTIYALTNSIYHEDFNYTDIDRVGAGTTLMVGWSFLESLPEADGEYHTSQGRDATGDTYSYGPQGQFHNERALGTLRSPTLSSQFGVRIQNQLGYAITALNITYTGEQWRLGDRTGAEPDRLEFAYKIGGGTLADGTWTRVQALDFNSVVTSGSAQALDGNDPANQRYIAYTITGLNIADGDTFWLRWSDFANPFGDDGLAVDELWVVVPEPPTWAWMCTGIAGCLLHRRLQTRNRRPPPTIG